MEKILMELRLFSQVNDKDSCIICEVESIKINKPGIATRIFETV